MPPPGHDHPPEFRRLCDEAAEMLLALKSAEPRERGERIPAIRALLARIAAEVEALDLRAPDFPEEQGQLVDAASALESIDLDRGGPHVARYVDRAVADVRRLAE
jgi:hypothetical protein